MSTKTMPWVLLLCMLVGTTMADAGSDNSGPWMWCKPGLGFPVYALPRCRAVVKLQCVGSQVPAAVLRDCRQQLADITNDWCRCGALSSMLRTMYAELGASGRMEVLPGCRKEVMKLTAASVPGVCKVPIPNPTVGRTDVCYWATYPDA
ncbi:hypothetical protein QYE76_000346 [Lolium multiflorum]|uniref:Bifunctional inhibitor/plant lipid transfer protein/seed storage helical domain-containing protein n=1 Tax=Lolium multiflorum TaxID=4521 RepID=A0AAD8RHC9_LOLMU|nr:hypothetical protein QYE76_000346 [Lolium multiflorum]